MKPHIKLSGVSKFGWYCKSADGVFGYGRDARRAYSNWLANGGVAT